jgi:nitric oxide synthase-interacting protein
MMDSTTCVDTLVKPSMQCPTCDEKVEAKDGGWVVALKCEGTGYAAGGMAEAKKFDVAFQG